MEATSVLIPTVLLVSLTLGTLTQLQDLAQQSADKSIKYADDATNAIDCAYTARPLSDCSPDLFSTDFKAEAEQTKAILEDLQKQEMGADLMN